MCCIYRTSTQFRAFVERNLCNFDQVSRNRRIRFATRYSESQTSVPLARPGFDATLIGITALAWETVDVRCSKSVDCVLAVFTEGQFNKRLFFF
jgi:hypothetical protein